MPDSTPQPGSVLLSLPYELRELILQDLLQSPNATPPDWGKDIIPTRKQTPTCEHRWSWDSRGLESWPPSPGLLAGRYPYNTSSALLTCHQLHNEIEGLVHRHPERYPYHLDLVLAPGTTCTPTWLSLPAPPSFYRDGGGKEGGLSLDVDIRQEGLTEQDRLENDVLVGRALKWRANASLAQPLCMLLFVLGNWLEYGPRLSSFSHGIVPDTIREPLISIDELRIHGHIFHDDVFEDVTFKWMVEVSLWDPPRSPGREALREEHLIENFGHLTDWLDILATSGLLFGRVGNMSFGVQAFEDLDDQEGLLRTRVFEVVDQREEVKRAASLNWADYGWVPGQKLTETVRLEREKEQAEINGERAP